VQISYEVKKPILGMRINLQLITQEGIIAFVSTDHSYQPVQLPPSVYKNVCAIPGRLLNIGVYTIKISAGIPGVKLLVQPHECVKLITEGPSNNASIFQRWLSVVCPKLKWTIS